MNVFTKKIAAASLAALTLGVTIAASSAPAEARWGRNAAIFGGLAAAAVGTAIIANQAYAEPVYGECWIEKRAVYNRYGDFAGYRRIRVCN